MDYLRKLVLLLVISALLSLSSCKRTSKDPEPDKNLLVLVGAIDSQKGILYAFDANTGTVKWTYETQQAIVGSPIISNDLAFFGSDKLYAVDLNTGKQEWQFDTGRPFDSSPVVVNGVLYIGCDDGNLYAIDATTGTKKWAYQYVEKEGRPTALLSSPYVTGGAVYINTIGGRVLAVDAVTGSLNWEFEAEDYIRFNPKVFDGLVYVNCLHVLYALDAKSGKLIWRTKTEFDNASSMAFNKTSLFCNNIGMSLYAFDAKTGKQQWTLSTGDYYAGGLTSSPTLSDNTLYVSMGEGNMYAVDIINKAVKWKTPTEANISASPTVANGVVYVGNWGNRMYGLNASTGQVIWSKQISGGIDISSACVLTAQGKVYYSSNAGASF